MPVFEIGLDDGRKLHIDAVDHDAAMAGVQHFLGQSDAPAEKKGGGVIDAVKAGAGNLLSGVGETGERYLGVGKALKDAGKSITPQDAPNTTLYDDKGFHAGNIPNAVAESSPSVAAAMAAARLMPGPIWAKLGAAGVVGLASSMGNFAKDATAKRTGNPDDVSSPDDLKAGAMRAAPEAAIQALPISRFLPAPVARLGAKGVAGALGRTAVDAAAMGSGNAGANVYDQASQNGSVDPTQVIDAAAKGAVTGGAFGGARFAQDAKAAVKYRGLADEDPAHITEAANRIQGANENLGGKLTNTRDGYNAFKSAQADVGKEFNDAVDKVKSNTLTPEAEAALNRAKQGLPLSDADTTALSASAHPDDVASLQRLGGIARVLQGVQSTGQLNDAKGQFTGGLSTKLASQVFALGHPLASGVTTAIAVGGAPMLAHSPEALAALGGAYGAARFADWSSGNRSPAYAFADRFADPSAITPPAPGTGLQALNAKASQAMSPTGPKIAPAPTPWGAPQAPAAPQAPQLPQFNPIALSALKKTMAATTKQLNASANQPPEAPQEPQLPQFNPIAMKMLKQNMANPPQPPQEAPAQLPQFNPMALKMLKQQMANPPQAPQPAPPEAPQRPQFNPVALKMLKQQMTSPPAPALPLKGAPEALDVPSFLPNRNAPPAAPQMPPEQPTPQSLVPAISKITKSDGKVKVEQAKPVAPKTVAAPLVDDDSIPAFLRRTPAPAGASDAPVAPQVQTAAKAMAKLSAGPKIDLSAEVAHPPEELAMSPKDFAAHRVAQMSPEQRALYAGKEEVLHASIERKVQWKADTAAKLAQLFPEVGDKKTFYTKLFAAHREMPIRQLRDALAAAHPDKAAEVRALLPNSMKAGTTKVWNRVN